MAFRARRQGIFSNDSEIHLWRGNRLLTEQRNNDRIRRTQLHVSRCIRDDYSVSSHIAPICYYCRVVFRAFAWDNNDMIELHSENGFITVQNGSRNVALTTVMSNGWYSNWACLIFRVHDNRGRRRKRQRDSSVQKKYRTT